MKSRVLILVLVLPLVLSADETGPVQPLSDTEADAIVAGQVAERAEREASRPINQVEFEVLGEKEVAKPDGTRLIVNRVAPPEIPEPEPEPVSDPFADLTEEQRAIVEEYGLSAAEVRHLSRFDFKEHVVLSLSATVYDPGITRIRWRHEDREYTAYSNIDFNHLRGVRGFGSPDGAIHYTLNMGIGDAEEQGFPDDLPELPAFDSERAEYIVDAADIASLGDEVLAPLDALHDWYEKHETRLKIETQRREAINAAWQRYHEANPPEETDTVIHYWRVPSER